MVILNPTTAIARDTTIGTNLDPEKNPITAGNCIL